MNRQDLPVVVIGAGPVGLAAAAHLLERGLSPLVLEAGDRVGASVAQWGHVRMFSPWRYVVDGASTRLLEPEGWSMPAPASFPNGRELVEQYLEPLAGTEALADRIRLNTRVTGVARVGLDRMKTPGRAEQPFVVRIAAAGGEEEILARAVVDASGTFEEPNPLGATGLPAMGERAAAGHIAYGMPEVLGRHRQRYAGRRVLVVGSGHSAFNVLLDLVALREAEPETQIAWAVRRPVADRLFGGGKKDQLEQRGKLGERVRVLLDSGALRLFTGFSASRVMRSAGGWVVADEARELPPVDEIVVATGFRPSLEALRELRLDLDPATESPSQLAPLIDPNVHSCGTVPPHGAAELQHPESDLYIVGMKSYGRAPTFLLLTGYEQVRSVAAAIAGDWEAATRVELVLPETGVCGVASSEGGDGCACGSPVAIGGPVAGAVSCCGSTKACCG